MKKINKPLEVAIQEIIDEIGETEKECSHRSCVGCKWNRRIRKVMKRTQARLKNE